jgi:dihydropteroate synthase
MTWSGVLYPSDMTGGARLVWHDRVITLEPGAVMGILNVTPDSFSDGGSFNTVERALVQARAMTFAGAAILDIGGESTRPGAAPTSLETELERVVPVIEAIRNAKLEVLISVDTRKPQVAHAAIQAGADLVNDVTGLRQAEMREVCARHGVPAIIMHMRGLPEQLGWSAEAEPFEDVVREVRHELALAAKAALEAGVPGVILDPGFGFGKSLEQNLRLVKNLHKIRDLGHPVLLGASRKSTLGRIVGIEKPAERDVASVAAHLYGVRRGADIVRVHDVPGHVQALKVWRAIDEV